LHWICYLAPHVGSSAPLVFECAVDVELQKIIVLLGRDFLPE
jgi:hypothetical protein